MVAADGLLANLVRGEVDVSERSMLAAIDRSQAMIEFSLDGRVLHANGNFLEAVGYSREELVGVHHSIFVDPDYATSAEYRLFWDRLRQGQYVVDKFRRLAKGGREIWIQASYNPIIGAEGKPVRIIKFATDITAQERFARDAQGQLEALSKTSAMIEFGLDGSILAANENFCRMVGYTADEIRGRHHSIFVDQGQSRGSAYAAFWASLACGEVQAGKFLRYGKGGRHIWIQAAYTPILGAQGQPIKIVKFATDITAHENFARDATAQLGAIAKSQAVVEFMTNGTVLTANENFCRLTGYSLDEIRARHHSMFLSGQEAQQSDYRQFWQALSQGEFRTGKFLRVGKGGRQIWIQASYNPVVDDRGAVVKIVKYASDVTEHLESEREAEELRQLNVSLEKARSEAEQAAVAKSRFLATMSHEIRTPMNGVLGMLEIALKGVSDPDQRSVITTARDSATSLLRILNDILDFSKLEAGELQLEATSFNLRQTIDAVLSIHHSQAEAKHLTLESRVDPSVPDWVLGDPTRVQQVLTNLVANAVKFTDQGSVAVLASWQADDRGAMLRVEVVDTGIGIEHDVVDRLFHRFSQADASTTRRYGGTGLGLAISREIVHCMSGDIGVHSTMGQGSTFWFKIPLAAAEPPVQASQTASITTKPMRLLIVDDNAVNRKVLQLFLAPQGHALTFASNGAEAVTASDLRRFDVILMDVSMPVMDGPTASRIIRSRPGPKGQVPIIALTANAMAGDREAYIGAGMTDYLSKPVDFEKLAEMLKLHGASANGSSAVEEDEARDLAPFGASDGGLFAAPHQRLDALIRRIVDHAA